MADHQGSHRREADLPVVRHAEDEEGERGGIPRVLGGAPKAVSWRDHFSLSNPKIWIFLAACLVLLVMGYVAGKKIFVEITEASDWFRHKAPWSILWYYVLLCICAVLLMPYGPFCVGIGFIFGLEEGLFIQFGALLLSNLCLFAVGRYLLRDMVTSRMKEYKVWKGIMHLLSNDWKEAAKINLLMCFMPIPYGSHAYLFSLSSVPFLHFIAVFMLGMIPTSVLDLLIGQALSEASDPDGANVYHMIGFGLVIAALFVAVVYAGSIAQRVLDEAEEEDPTSEHASLITDQRSSDGGA